MIVQIQNRLFDIANRVLKPLLSTRKEDNKVNDT